MVDEAEVQENGETYAGWPNRETWAAALHLTNCEEISRHWFTRAKKIGEAELAQELKEYFEFLWEKVVVCVYYRCEELALFEVNMLKDVGSLWRVDWMAVAKIFKEE